MNDPLSQFAVVSALFVGAMMAIGLFVDHLRHNYHALAEAEREAERQDS
jgi:hypothetical protein